MFGYQITFGTLAILITIIGHAAALVALARLLDRFSERYSSNFGLLSVSIVGIVFIHTVEAWAWAALFYGLGEFEAFEQALYFSVVTSTTLGYGDLVLSERWQLLGSFEAMGGLLLFGASTAFLIAVMRRLFSEENETSD